MTEVEYLLYVVFGDGNTLQAVLRTDDTRKLVPLVTAFLMDRCTARQWRDLGTVRVMPVADMEVLPAGVLHAEAATW